MRRVVVVISLVVLGLAAWWASRQQPAPVKQRAAPLPELPFEVFGRLVDAEGAPVEGAEVALFGERETWQRRYDSFFATRETDEGRDCGKWPLACSSDAWRAEVLRQLDAGTLAFPEPRVKTKTAADGRFSLPGATREDLVVAWKEGALARSDELSPWAELELAFSAPAEIELTEWTTALLFINPWTREVRRFTAADWDRLDVTTEGSRLWVEEADAGTEQLRIALWYDGGPVEGEIALDCGPDFSWTLRTDGGVATLETVARRQRSCRLVASTPELCADTYLLHPDQSIELEPRRSLTVRWTPPSSPMGATTVEVRTPVDRSPHPLGLGDIGTSGGGRVPGYGVFDAGVAVFDPLQVSSKTSRLEVNVYQPGFHAKHQVFEVKPGMTQLSLTLEPAPGTGFVVDEDGRAVPGLEVQAELADGGRGGWGETDSRGAFAVSGETSVPLVLRARQPLRGVGIATADSNDPVTLTLRPASGVTLQLALADGGVLASGIVEVSVDDDRAFAARAGPHGELKLPGLEPGSRRLTLKSGDAATQVTLEVPASGAVSKAVQLR